MPVRTESLPTLEAEAAELLRQVAASIVRPGFGARGEHHWASHTQVHTADDARAGEALARLFAERFPGHGLIVEDRPVLEGDGRHAWLIDPIDGSANHLRGIPYVSLTAGLRVDGELRVGVVHDPLLGVTWSAHAGGGARRREADGTTRPVRVAPTARLEDAIVIAHLSRRGPLVGRPGALAQLLWSVRKIRCMGSIALDLALLASGEADLLLVGRGAPQRMLDIAGGLVVLREAGGLVLAADGSPVSERTRTLAAGPPGLVRELLACLAPHDLEGWSGEQAVPPDGAAR